jgi:hypothetical protein
MDHAATTKIFSDYYMPTQDIAFLTDYCRDDLVPPKPDRARQLQRRKLLDHHAMCFTLGYLQVAFPACDVIDANTLRTNNPGYDILLDSKIRIQVKGRCWIEMIDFAVPSLEKMAGWKSDFWLCVDFSGLIDGRHGKYASTHEMAPNGRIDAYIMPTADLERLTRRYFPASKRPRIRAIKPGSLFSKKHHLPELFGYRDKINLISEFVTDPTASPKNTEGYSRAV